MSEGFKSFNVCQSGGIETEDAAKSGKPSTMLILENVDHVHDLDLADR